MYKLFIIAAILALVTFPHLTTSKCCSNDNQCPADGNICIKKKCIVGERFVALLTFAGSIGSLNPKDAIFQKKTSFPTAYDIAVSPDNLVYVLSNDNGLYEVDLQTEERKLIGYLTVPLIDAAIVWGPGNLVFMIGVAQSGEVVLSGIDPKKATVVSTISFPNFARNGGDIAWIPELQKFYSNNGANGELYSFTLDGTATRIGNIGAGVFAMAYNQETLYAYRSPNNQIIINLDGTFISDKIVQGLDDGVASAGR